MRRSWIVFVALLAVCLPGCGDSFEGIDLQCRVEIANAALPEGKVGTPYAGGPIRGALFGCFNLRWSIDSGELPPGIEIHPRATVGEDVAALSGTPRQAGTFTFVVTVRAEGASDTQAFSITIREADGSGPQ